MQCASVHMVCICRFLYEHLTLQRKTYSLLSIELIDIFFLGQLFTSFSNNPRIKELVISTHQAIAIGSMVNGPKFASNASMRYKNLGVTSGTVWRSNNPMHTISTHFNAQAEACVQEWHSSRVTHPPHLRHPQQQTGLIHVLYFHATSLKQTLSNSQCPCDQQGQSPTMNGSWNSRCVWSSVTKICARTFVHNVKFSER